MPVASVAGRLWDVASAVFDPLDAAFAATPTPLERRYVSNGAVAHDFGEHLMVECERVRPGVPGLPGGAGPGGTTLDLIHAAVAIQADFAVWVLRNAPVQDEQGNPPSPEALSASAELVLSDAWLALTTVLTEVIEGTFVDLGTAAAFTEQVGVGPDGGLVGTVLRIAVGL